MHAQSPGFDIIGGVPLAAARAGLVLPQRWHLGRLPNRISPQQYQSGIRCGALMVELLIAMQALVFFPDFFVGMEEKKIAVIPAKKHNESPSDQL